ncbi:MAG: hypothetical protein JW993_00610, partial [Sedimentisphaerales bacterium]|nr:hypothetical protein [Sedimentisphaerales bacterium]
MKAGLRYQRQLWVAAAAAAISLVISGIGLCRLGPAGKKVGVIQFDVVIELSNTHVAWDHGLFDPSTVWFARYWVCEDYYAVSVVWTEPHGMGDTNIKTLAVLSDKDGFRINNGLFPDWVPTNTTYAKPLGQRGPFQWGGGPYEVAEMRFAEAEALSRRVYAGDLESLQAPGKSTGGIIDLKPGNDPEGVRRKPAQLKVQAQAGRIESMDLLDHARQKLVGIEYEYDHSGPVPRIAKLIADLPVRPEKLAIDANGTITTRDGKIPYHYTDVDYVYHKGGRTSTVTYRDVTAGDVTLRLPVQVEVRRSDDKRLVRSAKLMNFKRVDLDKAAVWEAAKTYAYYTTEDWQVNQMVNKLSDRKAGLGPLKVDPNDLSF